MKSIKTALLASAFAFLAIPAMAASLTFGVGGTQAGSVSGTNSTSTSNGATAVIGVTAGTTHGDSTNTSVGAAAQQTTPGGTVGQTASGTQSITNANNASFSLGLAANGSGSTANAAGAGAGTAAGNFFTIVLSPLP
jgi:hypothetical protein